MVQDPCWLLVMMLLFWCSSELSTPVVEAVGAVAGLQESIRYILHCVFTTLFGF